MDEKKLRLIHTVCGIAVSVALVVAAICLIVSAYTIYKSGDAPYTPESIGAEYAKISVPLWIAVGSVIAGIVLNIALPAPKTKKKAQKDPFVQLRILQKKLPDASIDVKIKRERELRMLAKIICAVICLASFIPAVILLTWFDHFTVANLTNVILETVQLLLIGAVVSAVSLFILDLINRKSAEREIEWTKIAISIPASKSVQTVGTGKKSATNIIRLALVGIACVLVIIGVCTGDFTDVLQKAIRICTECIGLG